MRYTLTTAPEKCCSALQFLSILDKNPLTQSTLKVKPIRRKTNQIVRPFNVLEWIIRAQPSPLFFKAVLTLQKKQSPPRLLPRLKP
jgi:hypothetical protein